MEKRKYKCPAEMTISLIGGKWKVILLFNLRKNPKRFGELKRMTPGITQASLSQQLKELVSTGIVKRKELADKTVPAVEYSLTPIGESLKPIINAMVRWGISNQDRYAIGQFIMDGMNKD